MHVTNHPVLAVMADIARTVARRAGLPIEIETPEQYVSDPLLHEVIWPVYPEIASRLGISRRVRVQAGAAAGLGDDADVVRSRRVHRAFVSAYEMFSARFGNIYTARQLLQLFDRAYGALVPEEQAWSRPDGRYADPFRPHVEPNGFATVDDVSASRAQHLAAVREMFQGVDILVFTLGLTEGWRAVGDGSVFPLAPGVAAGEMDDD